jgi:mannose-6-phosphate isomerase-like protein (cupin superfamily)
MKGYLDNIEEITLNNQYFRKVLFTGQNMQLVVMSIDPNEDIGLEIHSQNDQFLRVEAGEGKVIIDGQEGKIEDGSAIIIPAGAEHNIINTSPDKPLKLYTLYAPPHHKDGVIHQTKSEALADEEDHH